VLVQSNFGGILTINGAPVGRELGKYYLKEQLGRTTSGASNNSADGSIIIVIATDAPIDHRNLQRLAARSMMGLARTGSAATNGSGDYAIAFSTAAELHIRPPAPGQRPNGVTAERPGPQPPPTSAGPPRGPRPGWPAAVPAGGPAAGRRASGSGDRRRSPPPHGPPARRCWAAKNVR